jgi:hypothetical protein
MTLPTAQNATTLKQLAEVMMSQPDALVGDSPEYLEHFDLSHQFGKGLCVRTLVMPKGMLMLTKIHRFRHPYFIMSGKVSVYVNGEVTHIEAPFQGMTEPATQRVIYAHEETTWITVHATEETDIEKIEEEIIAPNFDEFLLEEELL